MWRRENRIMRRFSPLLIGVFLLGALALSVIGIIFLGGEAWWRDREQIVLFFNESVQGLDRGSAVRLMGVRVGQVTEINVRYTDVGTRVQVICEIDSSPTLETDLRDREVLEKMVADGLQARLDLIGITGMLFVEMDFFGGIPEEKIELDHPDLVVVPTVPSILTGMTDNLAEIAGRFGEVDLGALGESTRQLIDTVNTTLEEAQIGELVQRLTETVEGLQKLIDSPELERTIVAAGESFKRIDSLASRLEEQVDPLSESFSETAEELHLVLKNFNSTLLAVQELVGPRLGLGYQVGETLTTIDHAARAVERLAEFLERNPQAILRGTVNE